MDAQTKAGLWTIDVKGDPGYRPAKSWKQLIQQTNTEGLKNYTGR